EDEAQDGRLPGAGAAQDDLGRAGKEIEAHPLQDRPVEREMHIPEGDEGLVEGPGGGEARGPLVAAEELRDAPGDALSDLPELAEEVRHVSPPGRAAAGTSS